MTAIAAAGEPPRREMSPRRIAAPTRIPDPLVAGPAGEAVEISTVPRAVRRAVAGDAARRFKVEQTAVLLVRAERVTWSDGSLGCAEPGRMYTQALVSGYRIVAKTAAGEMLYHTDARGDVRTCGAATTRSQSVHERLKQQQPVEPRTGPPAAPTPDR